MAHPAGPGRTPRVSSELVKKICENIALPMPFKFACEREGISETTGHEWLRKGQEGKAPYVEFSVAVSRARAEAVANLTRHALGGGRGSMNAVWLLERRYRDHYGNVQRIEHAGHDGGAVKINTVVGEMSDEELKKLAGGV